MRNLIHLLLLLTAATGLRADTVYTVSLNTSALPVGVYYLDFQLISGDDVVPNANNTAIVDLLALGGGAPTASAVLNGNAAGTFATGFTLSDGQFYNAALQPVTLGSAITFRLDYTTNFTSGFPDQFSFALLDSSFNSIVSTGVGASMVVDITGNSAAPVVFAADPLYGGIIPTFTMVPEPSTGLLVLVPLALWAGRKRLTAGARKGR